MHRRTLLASAATALTPALAGCSPCGETWSSSSFDVTPTSLASRGEGWAVEADVSVRFNFGREGDGVRGSALAAFDADGKLLSEEPLGDLLWDDVPEEERTEGDCGDYGSLSRSATVRSNAFPRWIGLRFDRATEALDGSNTVAKYPDATADGTPDARDYASVRLPVESGRDPPAHPEYVDDVRFSRGDESCRDATSNVEFGRELDVRWYRDLPAPRFHPVFAGASVDGDRLQLDVGLDSGPQFRRLRCHRQVYRATVDVGRTSHVDTVEVRHLDPAGELVERRSFARPPSETPTVP